MRALFAGTFDPPTLGHLDIIQRSRAICDQLFVAVAENPSKQATLFNALERKALLEKICAPYPHVKVVISSALTATFAKDNNIDFLLRGLRTASDFEVETRMAIANRNLSGTDTLFLIADPKAAHISSTLIREIGKFNGRLHDYVPHEIENEIFNRIAMK